MLTAWLNFLGFFTWPATCPSHFFAGQAAFLPFFFCNCFTSLTDLLPKDAYSLLVSVSTQGAFFATGFHTLVQAGLADFISFFHSAGQDAKTGAVLGPAITSSLQCQLELAVSQTGLDGKQCSLSNKQQLEGSSLSLEMTISTDCLLILQLASLVCRLQIDSIPLARVAIWYRHHFFVICVGCMLSHLLHTGHGYHGSVSS